MQTINSNTQKDYYLKFIENTFSDWEKLGYCPDAKKINENIGYEYFGITNPHFFTGDLDSDLVLIHLNPKRDLDPKNNVYPKFSAKESGFSKFEEYINYYSNFGKINYGLKSNRKHKSPFDHKQIRFLKPFKLIPLENSDRFLNLENVIDRKLQLELIPFGSNDFNFRKVGLSNLKSYIELILMLILCHNRKYVIFCGTVFRDIFKDYIIEQNRITFKLKKKDGQETKNEFEIVNIIISVNGQNLNCAIAPQFAKQGYPVEEYGLKIKSLYGKF